MAMGITLTENGDKTENPGLEAETLAVSGDQCLAGKLGCAIKRCLYWKRRIFRGWNHRRFAIHRTGRRKCDALDVIRAHGLQHVISGDGVLIEILARMLRAKTHIGVGGKMENEVGTLHGAS